MTYIREYTHPELGEDIAVGIGGSYIPQQEIRLNHNDREVLYVIGNTNIESACCGVSNWNYALVPGYIVNWQNKKNEAGLPVSEVEPISDEATRKKVKKIIQDKETVTQVIFW